MGEHSQESILCTRVVRELLFHPPQPAGDTVARAIHCVHAFRVGHEPGQKKADGREGHQGCLELCPVNRVLAADLHDGGDDEQKNHGPDEQPAGTLATGRIAGEQPHPPKLRATQQQPDEKRSQDEARVETDVGVQSHCVQDLKVERVGEHDGHGKDRTQRCQYHVQPIRELRAGLDEQQACREHRDCKQGSARRAARSEELPRLLVHDGIRKQQPIDPPIGVEDVLPESDDDQCQREQREEFCKDAVRV